MWFYNKRRRLLHFGECLFLTALLAFLFVEIISSSVLLTQNGYIASWSVPWKPTTAESWAQAKRVTVGCDNKKGRNLYYRVKFQSGREVWIENAEPVSGGWLDQVERIDQQLRKRETPFVKYTWWTQPDAFNPKCLAELEQRTDPETYARIYRLIRVAELSGRE